MGSYQSELGEGEEIARELAADQRAISIAEFFEKNKHMLGFDSEARALVTAVKEGVDNSLDAAEEAGVLPDIYVEIEEAGDYYRLTIEDNGPGITREQVPKVFGKLLYGSRFHKREQSLLPDQRVLIRRDGDVELIEIGQLCDAYLAATEGDGTVRIQDDIQAPCFDRETGQMTWQDVTHVIRHETRHDTYRIETSRGREIEVTGNHSLFTLGQNGDAEEVPAADLEPGDHVLAPERIPAPDDIDSVNLLKHVPRSELDDRNWYVYGIDRDLIDEIEDRGERVRKYPTRESERKRTYYRVNGVDVLKDSLTNNYRPKGYLPADLVVDLGWEDRVAEGFIRTYQIGGMPDEAPVTVPLTEEFMRFLGLYIAEGHSDARQVGFTFGSHETELIEEAETTAGTVFDASTTTLQRPRNSTRVKAFGSPLATFLEHVCGNGASNKRVPGFVFRAPSELQQAFIDALYDGDGTDSHPANELTYTTTSERLARELSYLWSMRGVVASWKERHNSDNISGKETTVYEVLVHGKDINRSAKYTADTDRIARYRRLPVSLLEDLAIEQPDVKSVPATVAGVFRAAGFGSQLTYADKFAFRADRAINGGSIPDDYYRRSLEENGFLTVDGAPTEKLHELWERAKRLTAFGDSDLCLLRVENVRRLERPDYVYDISVPGSGADENFVAGNRGALCVKNSRGQQGIGISAAVLYAQLTSGKPARITSKTKGSNEADYFELIIDTDANEPEIGVEETRVWEPAHGTRIELEMEANMRARSRLHDYIEQTAVVNPHARIELREPGLEEPLKFDRVEGADLPAETEEIRPHPHGVELGTLIKMLDATDSYSVSGFLQEEFTRVGKKTAESLIDAFRDRHFGREMAWRPPRAHEEVDVEAAVRKAVANKGAEATAAFAARVADAVGARERIAHHQLVAVVDEAAADIEGEFDATFGSTVRENAVAAAWEAVTAELDADVYGLVDEATTTRKDDATVRGLAERIAAKFERADDGRHRLTRAAVRGFVDRSADDTEEFDDATVGETAREKITDALWAAMRTVPDDPPKVRAIADDRDAASDLLEAMRATDIRAPPTDCLSPITADLVEAGLEKEFDADFYAAATRDAEVHGGDPFIVEAGIAYGGDLEDGSVDVLRFANRVPLVYQRGACATTDVVKRIGWRNYGLDQPGGSGMPNGPAVIMVHVASTNVPFTSESKDAVANVPAIEDEIELAIREAARDLKSYLNRRRSLRKRRKKEDVLATILPEMADKLADVADREPLDIEDSLARIMNNVLVERTVEDGRVALTVENHTGANASLELTDIVSVEPVDADGATVVEMDGEWFVKWAPTVESGDRATLEYGVDGDGDAAFDLSVDGVEDAKLTVNA